MSGASGSGAGAGVSGGGSAGDGGGSSGTAGSASGSGGAGSGGDGGKAGGGKGGVDCDDLLLNLNETLEEAQACTSGRQACRGFVDDECGCPVPVNDPDSELTSHYLVLLEEIERSCDVSCPACEQPVDSTCLMPIIGNRGSCTARYR
jgi:hypothetical protein